MLTFLLAHPHKPAHSRPINMPVFSTLLLWATLSARTQSPTQALNSVLSFIQQKSFQATLHSEKAPSSDNEGPCDIVGFQFTEIGGTSLTAVKTTFIGDPAVQRKMPSLRNQPTTHNVICLALQLKNGALKWLYPQNTEWTLSIFQTTSVPLRIPPHLLTWLTLPSGDKTPLLPLLSFQDARPYQAEFQLLPAQLTALTSSTVFRVPLTIKVHVELVNLRNNNDNEKPYKLCIQIEDTDPLRPPFAMTLRLDSAETDLTDTLHAGLTTYFRSYSEFLWLVRNALIAAQPAQLHSPSNWYVLNTNTSYVSWKFCEVTQTTGITALLPPVSYTKTSKNAGQGLPQSIPFAALVHRLQQDRTAFEREQLLT